MARVRIKYKPLPKQKDFHDDLISDMPAFLAGLGSGKSHALTMKLLRLSWLNKDLAGGLLCPTVQDFKRDMLPLFQTVFDDHGLSKYCKYNRSDTCFTFPWTTKPLYVFTGERPIAGPNLAYCGINEPSLIKEIRVNEMLRRVRVKNAPYPQRCLAGTPEDAHGWLQDFVEKHQKTGKLKLYHGSTKDNTYLDEGYYEHLRETLDPNTFRVMAEGELIFIGSNLFYYAYSKENHTTQEFDREKPFYVNLDFNVGNMTATICQQNFTDKGEKISVFVDEIVIKHESADTYIMANALNEKYHGLTGNMMITCDASGKARKTTGPSDVNVLKRIFGEDSVRYRASGNIRMRPRQILVNGNLSHKRILVNPEKCPNLDKDLRKVVQIEDYTKCKKNADLTHSSDTLDYYCDFEYKIESKESFNIYKAR